MRLHGLDARANIQLVRDTTLDQMEDFLKFAANLIALTILNGSFFIANATLGAERQSATPPGISSAAQITDAEMQEMHIAIQNLQKQMEVIHATTDPAERQKLMVEHIARIRDIVARARETLNGGLAPPGIIPGMGWPSPRIAELYTQMLQNMIDQVTQHLEMMNRQRSN